MPLRCLLALLFLAPLFSLQAQTATPQLKPEPLWIVPTPVSATTNTLDADAEDGAIDLLYEKQISIAQQEVYINRQIKLLSEAGVQNSSEVSIDYDPSFQQLFIHHINIVRNGTVQNRLQLSKFSLVRQEKELSNFIYNGTQSAVLFLEDVQKGDIIQYSYTLHGFNPIFNGRYSSVFDMRFSVPVYQIHYRVVTPSTLPLQIKNTNSTIKPAQTQQGSALAYDWNVTNAPAIHTEENVPSWYNPYPEVMISNFQNWKEVADWARTLFPFNAAPDAAIAAKAKELQQKYSSEQDQLRAALRFVQDDIRYMGIEMGVHSHQPHAPGTILRQRFGDCKDKSYLLCSLLQAMGITAQPVLINTQATKSLHDLLPAPTVFDHTTVHVTLNGKEYWFDPTISFQRGPLDSISYPDYGAGLMITDTTTALTVIPVRPQGQVRIKEIFDIPDMSGRVKLKVLTIYSGSFADNTRSDFKNTSNYELRKTYTDFYNYYFKNIHADSLFATDNDATGVFTTTEYYTLDSVWGKYAYMKEASFEPYVINSLLKKPNDTHRTMPYSLRYPAPYDEEILVNLPEPWNIKHSTHSSDGAAFSLNADYTCTGKQIILKYNFAAHKDHLAPDEMADYINNVKQAEDGIAYSLTSTVTQDAAPGSFSGSGNYTTLYLMLGLCVAITYGIRKKR